MTKSLLSFAITAAFLFAVTFGILMFAKGYRPNPKDQAIEKTGMIFTRSTPEGAKIFLDNELKAVTEDSIAGLRPGTHQIKLVKEGYSIYEKSVPVFEEMVTEINAVLVPTSPRIEPLTTTGARHPALSNSRDRIAYFNLHTEKPGIWALPLSGQPVMSLFRTSSNLLTADNPQVIFSLGDELQWSPDDSQLLMKMNDKGYYVIDLRGIEGRNFEATSSAEPTLIEWGEELAKKRLSFLDKVDGLPEPMFKIATDSATLWSPNDKKFLYVKEDGEYLEYRVQNLEDPIEVGGKEDYISLRVKKTEPMVVSWYSDSRYLILVEGDVEKNGEGTISLIEIDGGNKTEVYSGKLASNQVFPTPGGDKLLFLASFKLHADPDLYAVSLR